MTTDQTTATALPHDDARTRKNVLVLAVAGALGGAAGPINFAVAALAAYAMLGDDKSLATVPATAFVVGTACGTVPAALLMRSIGRRWGFIAGMLVSVAGALLSTSALAVGSFALLCAGSFLVGFASAFVQQFRFAAADTASPGFRPRAISLVMAGGVASAIIGPQTVIHSADLFDGAEFAGAFMGSAALSLLAAAALLFLDIPRARAKHGTADGRPLPQIVRQPTFIVAVACATSAYAMMSFIMTAAPLAMVMHHHHQNEAILGIQWHVLAMFAPSFFTGSLIGRFGAHRIVALGLLLLIACALVGLSGTTVGHFWLALVLLGVGWNFAFVGGTDLVTRTYVPAEREKVQALNDFLVFGVVALASFSSGGVLVVGGWSVLNVLVLPFAIGSLAALLWLALRARRLGEGAASRP